MDAFTKGLLFMAGASWGVTYALYRRPLSVPCTGDGRPITQEYAQKMIAARNACNQVEPVLESLSSGSGLTLADIYGVIR